MPYTEGVITVEIFRTKIYVRKCRKLLSDKEREVAEAEILEDPEAWPLIAGTGGVRKARAARGNSGKSGGVRILYYVWLGEGEIYFLDVYAKNDKEDVSEAEKVQMKRFILGIKEL